MSLRGSLGPDGAICRVHTSSTTNQPYISMNKPILLLTAVAAVVPTAWGADQDLVPSLVIGDKEYVLPRSEYNKIVINHDGTITLESNEPGGENITLNWADASRVYVQDMPADEISTSIETIEADARESRLTYDATSLTLGTDSGESLYVTVYNLAGQAVLSGRVGGLRGSLSVALLPEGMYIASANGMSLKFIKR